MHLFIPYFDVIGSENALQEARRIVWPGDCVTVMTSVIVPGDLPVDIEAGAIWERVCRAEQHLFHARETAERIFPPTVALHFVRVQARDRATAIRVGAMHYRADLILLPLSNGIRGAFAMRFGVLPAVLRDAPCSVRFVRATMPLRSRSPVTAPSAIAPLSSLQIIAVNPASAMSGAEDGVRKIKGRHDRMNSLPPP